MSLNDVIKGFAGEPVHRETARGPVATELERTRRSFAERKDQTPPDAWFSMGEPGMIGFQPRRPDGQPIVVNGQAITFWSEGEFPAMLDAFEAALNDGELDAELAGNTPAGGSLALERLTSRMRAARD